MNIQLAANSSSPIRRLEKTFANRGCLLHCIALPLTGGGFHAQVEIVRYDDNEVLVDKTIVSLDRLQNAKEAIECARAWSVSWINQKG
jgi:hypothetical protein